MSTNPSRKLPTRSGATGGPGLTRAWVCICILQALAPAFAQVADGPASDPEVNSRRIAHQISQIQENAQGLEEQQKQNALNLLKEAQDALELVEGTRERTAAFQKQASQSPTLKRQVQLQAEKLTPELYEVPEVLPAFDKVSDKLNQLNIQLTEAQTQRAQYESSLKALTSPEALAKDISRKQAQIQSTQEQLQALEGSQEPAAVKTARRTRLLAGLQLAQAELEQLQVRQATLQTRQELLVAQRDLAQKQVGILTPAVEAWQEAYNRAEQLENQRKQEEAQRATEEAGRLHPALEAYADGTSELLALGQDLSQQRNQEKSYAQRIEQIQRQYKQMQQRVEVDLPGDLGQAMRADRQSLPDRRELVLQLEQTRTRIEELRQLQDKLQLRMEQFAAPAIEARQLTSSIQAPPDQKGQIEQAALELAQDRQEALRSLLNESDGKLTLLRQRLQKKQEELVTLIAVTRQYRQFIDENILYIRSMDPIWLKDLQRLAGAVAILANPELWRNVLGLLADQASRRPVLLILAVVILGGLLLAQPRLIRRLRSLDRRVMKKYPGRFLETVWALLITLGLTLCWPGILAFVGWRLWASPLAERTAYALGVGLLTVSAAWIPIMLIRQICRREGLAETHFRWNQDVTRLICRSMLRLSTVGVPLLLLLSMGETHGSPEMEALGRLATIVGLLGLTVWTRTLLRSDGVFVQNTIARRKDSWLWRLRKLWVPLVVVVPLALALASGAGYHYTAIQLLSRMLVQAAAIILLILANALLLRWVLLGRRRLALATLAKRRQAQKLRSQQEQEEPGEAPPEAKEPQIDLSAIGVQTRQFIRYLMAASLLISVWLVWKDVLPALQFLDRFVIYGQVTLQSLMLAAALVALTVVVSRNLPGILDITLFHRLQIDTGSQFALNALIRYVALVVGLVMAFNTIGVHWGDVQWLVAAMTVGLGFGLQEIFANFVSGLIILIERPIRVGDIVTVGDVTGTVTQVRMRATTVTDWDRKELIVPNRDFITTQLVNWTLSDKVIRVVVPVGIAYGSETEKARKILLDVAEKNQRVLAEPTPTALFVGFGASSLDFELRAFVGGFRDFLEGRSELHMEIDQAFREAGIEISFPQRDLHIRSVEAAFPVEARQVEKILRSRFDAGPEGKS
jgi:potassium efflux system protein